MSLRVDYVGRFPVGVVRSGGRILAFASLVGEGLPAPQDDIDISRADLETAADAAGHFVDIPTMVRHSVGPSWANLTEARPRGHGKEG
jgi:hypothetical protein